MTRIIAGFAGSRRLQVPRSGTRPTSDRVREALFSLLEARGAVRGARVLDLYAGSGALGLEAISRGAASATLVERASAAARALRANAALVGGLAAPPQPELRVVPASVSAYLDAAGAPGSAQRGAFDLILLDPPYELPEPELAEALAAAAPLLSAEGLLVVERSARSPEPAWPEALEPQRRRDYGETALWLAQLAV